MPATVFRGSGPCPRQSSVGAGLARDSRAQGALPQGTFAGMARAYGGARGGRERRRRTYVSTLTIALPMLTSAAPEIRPAQTGSQPSTQSA